MAEIAAIAGIVSIAATAASTAYSFISAQKVASQQKEAAKAAREIGNFNAANVRAETEEMARRQQLQNERLEATATARAAATGFKSGQGSLATYIQDLQQENTAELDWLIKSGMSRASLEEKKGEYSYLTGLANANATSASGWSGLISGIGGVSSGLITGRDKGWW